MKSNRQIAAVFALACAIGACSSAHNMKPANPPAAASAPVSLVGTEWILRDVAGTPVLDKPEATLLFPEAGHAAGSGSCNRFTGSVEITGTSIKFGPLASTRMACMNNDVGSQEDHYLKALGVAKRYSVENGDLLIYCEGYDKPLRFSRAASAKP